MRISIFALAALALGCLSLVGTADVLAAAKPAKPGPDGKQQAALWAQGKYLVTGAAPCADCHTPRDHKGRLIESRALQGAPIDFTPNHPVPDWMMAAPPIAGLPQGWTFDQTVHFLETGMTPGGGHANPPMPPFRFNAYDARAVATYLQSLPKPTAKHDHSSHH